jgi:hypothetical protein
VCQALASNSKEKVTFFSLQLHLPTNQLNIDEINSTTKLCGARKKERKKESRINGYDRREHGPFHIVIKGTFPLALL